MWDLTSALDHWQVKQKRRRILVSSHYGCNRGAAVCAMFLGTIEWNYANTGPCSLYLACVWRACAGLLASVGVSVAHDKHSPTVAIEKVQASLATRNRLGQHPHFRALSNPVLLAIVQSMVHGNDFGIVHDAIFAASSELLIDVPHPPMPLATKRNTSHAEQAFIDYVTTERNFGTYIVQRQPRPELEGTGTIVVVRDNCSLTRSSLALQTPSPLPYRAACSTHMNTTREFASACFAQALLRRLCPVQTSIRQVKLRLVPACQWAGSVPRVPLRLRHRTFGTAPATVGPTAPALPSALIGPPATRTEMASEAMVPRGPVPPAPPPALAHPTSRRRRRCGRR